MSQDTFGALGNTLVIAGTVASANGALDGIPAGGQCVRVYNAATAVAFVRFSAASGPVAVTTDAFVAPGATETIGISSDAAFAAAILASGTGNVYFQRGAGV